VENGIKNTGHWGGRLKNHQIPNQYEKCGLAVWMFHEPFSSGKLVTFMFIWAGILLYLLDSFCNSRIKDVPPHL